jgi:hypothetical protein
MRALIGAALLAAGVQAEACGYCVEDKIAATYDHAVVTQALARKHQVAFFHVDSAAPGRAALERAAYAAGADKGSVRVAADLLTLSFAFDPARATLGVVHAQMEKALAGKRVSLMPFEVIDQPGQLKAIKTAR